MDPLTYISRNALSKHTTRVAYFILSYLISLNVLTFRNFCSRVDVSISNECDRKGRAADFNLKIDGNGTCNTIPRIWERVRRWSRYRLCEWSLHCELDEGQQTFLYSDTENRCTKPDPFFSYFLCLSEVRLTEACSHFVADCWIDFIYLCIVQVWTEDQGSVPCYCPIC
jgi:hypothetical protein